MIGPDGRPTAKGLRPPPRPPFASSSSGTATAIAYPADAIADQEWSLAPIETVLPADLVAELGTATAVGVMILTVQDFLQIDLPALLVAVFSAVSCGLLGNYLVLRRQALVGDAISHLVLPGIVVGFLVAGGLSTMAMMGGALAAALLGVLLIDLIRRFGPGGKRRRHGRGVHHHVRRRRRNAGADRQRRRASGRRARALRRTGNDPVA